MPRIPDNPVVVGTALIFNDIQTSGELSDITRKTLNMMWSTHGGMRLAQMRLGSHGNRRLGGLASSRVARPIS